MEMPNLETIITAVGGLLTGALGAFGAQKAQRKDKYQMLLDNYQQIIANQDKRISELELENKKLETMTMKLQMELTEIKSKMIFQSALGDENNKIEWFKAVDGRMLSFNKAYVDRVILPAGKDPHKYINATNLEFWGDEIAKIYDPIDQTVATTGKTWVGFIKIFDKYGNEKESLFQISAVQMGGDTIGTRGQELISRTDLEKLL